jgi:hypothetical protein
MWLASWTRAPRTVFEGWLAPDDDYQPPNWLGHSFRAIYVDAPADAGPPPKLLSRWTIIRDYPPGGWSTEIC